MTADDNSKSFAGVITGLSVSYRSADIDIIERATPTDPEQAMQRLVNTTACNESILLNTCNRVEWFVVAPSAEQGNAILADFVPNVASTEGRWLDHEQSLTHLLRVAAGLDSMVLGEDQILGQLRDACAAAERAETLGPILKETVWKAIHTGEHIRTETAINEGVVSLARAAIDLAKTEMSLDGRDVLLIGAGDMGRRAAFALNELPVGSVRIANRTQSRAVELAERLAVPTEIVPFTELERAVRACDLVLAATNSDAPVLTESMMQHAGETFAIDLGQPRDIDRSGAPESIRIIDLDDLESITEKTHEERATAAAHAEEIIEAERRHLEDRFKRKQADTVIRTMYESAETMKAQEVAEAKSLLDSRDELTGSTESVIESLADALVSQLLAAPTKSLRDAAADDDWETIQTALTLFDPEFPNGGIEPVEQTQQQEVRLSENS